MEWLIGKWIWSTVESFYFMVLSPFQWGNRQSLLLNLRQIKFFCHLRHMGILEMWFNPRVFFPLLNSTKCFKKTSSKNALCGLLNVPIFLSLEEIFASLESVKRILAHPKCISGPPQENAYHEKWAWIFCRLLFSAWCRQASS